MTPDNGVRRVALTGGRGFLGQHVRAALQEQGAAVSLIPLGEGYDPEQARAAVSGADRVLHLAGVNRGTDAEVTDGNALFADQLIHALDSADEAPSAVVFADSIQAANDSPYGIAKRRAGVSLDAAASARGIGFEDVRLPNLYGERGRPFYNSVVATFCHLIAEGGAPEVHEDRELTLLHAQDAADVLIGAIPVAQMGSLTHQQSVSQIKDLILEQAAVYREGEFPDLSSSLRRDMFNTYRSFTFPASAPIAITRHADQRGSFFEIVRSHGGTGQTSFSTTEPGVSRGDHYHRRKVERFTVLSGEAEISLRHLFEDTVHTFHISGDAPCSVDMPTLYAHNITNVGGSTLYTAFWTNDIFDPTHPDTIPEAV